MLNDFKFSDCHLDVNYYTLKFLCLVGGHGIAEIVVSFCDVPDGCRDR